MSQRTIARRYATALYQEADEAGVLDAVDDDVLMLRRSLESNRQLSNVFVSPVISREKKDAIVQELLKDRVEPLLVQFLRLLIEKDRETITKAVLDRYQDLRDEHRDIVDATVRVARPLTEDDREALTAALEKKTGQSVRLHVEEEPELIGGLMIRIGDRVYDASVRNQLSNLHSRLREASLSLDAESMDANGQAN